MKGRKGNAREGAEGRPAAAADRGKVFQEPLCIVIKTAIVHAFANKESDLACESGSRP